MIITELIKAQEERFDSMFGPSWKGHARETLKQIQLELLDAERRHIIDLITKWNGDGQSFTKGILDDLRERLDALVDARETLREELTKP